VLIKIYVINYLSALSLAFVFFFFFFNSFFWQGEYMQI